MTMAEANQILDIVIEAQMNLMHLSHRRPPISALKGYDIYQIFTAFKLIVANEFLILAWRNDFEKQFEDGLSLYDSCIINIMGTYVPDNQVDNILAESVFNPIDWSTMTLKDWEADIESVSSFGDYCKSLGTNDPLFWQKVYTRLGLEYTSTSPKGNNPCRAGECD
jgi:hypothetical protein